jgi:hypothetical protein
MLDGPILVFVEVRYRHADGFMAAPTDRDRTKQRKSPARPVSSTGLRRSIAASLPF